MSYDVFISYAREDAAAAMAVVASLEKLNVSCWIDRHEIAHKHGEEWAEEIVAAIEQSTMMVLIFSRHANASKYVKVEVHKAFNLNRTIIPFRIEDVAPQGAFDLHLPTSQWLDAFPLYEEHLGTLTGSVCRILDREGSAERHAIGEQALPVGWQRYLSAHAWHLFQRALNRNKPSSQYKAERRLEPDGQSSGRFNRRKEIHEQAAQESLRALVSSNRWWRIKELIELLESNGMPLGKYAEAKQPLEKKLAAFRKVHDAATDGLGRLGPAKIEPYLEKMREVIADHPDIAALSAKLSALSVDRGSLRHKLASLAQQGRWTAVENAIRSFALGQTQATESVLQAAEKASVNASRESRRFDLLAWTVLAGAVTLWVSYGVVAWVGMTNDGFQNRFPEAWQSLLVPLVSVFVRFGTTSVVVGFLLAFFGVRHQGTFAGASIGLMIFAAGAQALPWSVLIMPENALPASTTLAGAMTFLSCAAFAVGLVASLQIAARKVIGASTGVPGLTACAAAALASHGFMPAVTSTGNLAISQMWSRWLPDGFACAALLACIGVINRKKTWWVLPVFAGGLGVVGPMSHHWADGAGTWTRAFPGIIGLIVAGWMATFPKTIRGYLAIVVSAGAAGAFAEILRTIDAGNGMLPFGRLAPTLSLWAIACGSVALAQKGLLSEQMHVWDMIAKQLLRIQCMRSEVRGRQLVETEWYLKGRKAHATPPAAAEGLQKKASPRAGGTSR